MAVRFETGILDKSSSANQQIAKVRMLQAINYITKILDTPWTSIMDTKNEGLEHVSRLSNYGNF